MASVELKLSPFPRPQFVTVQMPPGRREDGFGNSPKIRIVDLTREQLTELINEFSQSLVAEWIEYNERGEFRG